jgi:ADP-heptose:LPS heptosyltransferase
LFFPRSSVESGESASRQFSAVENRTWVNCLAESDPFVASLLRITQRLAPQDDPEAQLDDTFPAMRLKRLELWWRGLWIRILVRLMRRPATSESRPDWGSRPFRVLFLRHDRAGDMIVSTGVMRGIAQSHSTITLDVLASPANAGIIDGADYVHEIVVFNKKTLGDYIPTLLHLRRARYDAVVDCMVTAPSVTTLLLILASGARYRVGIAGRGNDAAFNVAVPAETRAGAHMVDLLAALAGAFDVSLDENERHPVLAITEAERKRAEASWGHASFHALINISAGTSERDWSDDRYVAVIKHLAEHQADIALRVISSPGDAERAQRIARDGGGEYSRTPGIRDAFALIATADFVFTPDTSIAHAASAFRVPTVAIYVRGKSERWGLCGTVGENVEHPEPNFETLGVGRVTAAIDRVLASTVSSRA